MTNRIVVSFTLVAIVAGTTFAEEVAIPAAQVKHLKKISLKDCKITSVALTSDGNCVIIGSQDRTLQSWDLVADSVVEFNSSEFCFSSLVISPDDSVVICDSKNRSISVFDLKNKKKLREIEGNWRHVTEITCSNDSEYFAVRNSKNSIQMFRISTGEIYKEFEGHGSDSPAPIAITKDFKFIASSGENGVICVREIQTGKQTRQYLNKELVRDTERRDTAPPALSNLPKQLVEQIVALNVSNDILTAVSGDSVVWQWSMTTGELTKKLELPQVSSSFAKISSNGRYVLSDHNGQLVDLKSGGVILKVAARFNIDEITGVAISRDCRRIAIARMNGVVDVWEIVESSEDASKRQK